METMSRDQAESSCAIQSKFDALLSNSISQEKTASQKSEKQPITRVDFVEPQCKKQESTPLPQINNSISGMTKTATKGGVSSSTRTPWYSSAQTSITPDAMTWANTWEMVNRTLEVIATRTHIVDLRTMLRARFYTLLKDNAPTPEEMRQKSREYKSMSPKTYSFSDGRILQGSSQQQRSTWYKPRDDMEKRR